MERDPDKCIGDAKRKILGRRHPTFRMVSPTPGPGTLELNLKNRKNWGGCARQRNPIGQGLGPPCFHQQGTNIKTPALAPGD